MLVQRTLSPESSSSPLSSPPTSAMHGYLLFHPRGWSQALLHSLVFTGTRIGGIRERDAQGFESGAGSWPRDFVGSEQGRLWWDEKAVEDKYKWDSKPPAKRANYLKSGWEDVELEAKGRVPWKPDWAGLATGYPADAATEDEEMAVNDAPSKVALYLLQPPSLADLVLALLQTASPAAALLSALNQQRAKRSLPPLEGSSAADLLQAATVRVSVDLLARGVAGEVGPVYSLGDDAAALEEERLWRDGYSGGKKGRDVDHEAEVRRFPPSALRSQPRR